MEKAENKNTVSINFRCTPEMKRSIEILALASHKKDVSTFITDLLSQVVEVNRGVIDPFNAAEVISPFVGVNNETTPKKKSGTKKKKTTAQVLTPDAAPDESAGVTNEN